MSTTVTANVGSSSDANEPIQPMSVATLPIIQKQLEQEWQRPDLYQRLIQVRGQMQTNIEQVANSFRNSAPHLRTFLHYVRQLSNNINSLNDGAQRRIQGVRKGMQSATADLLTIENEAHPQPIEQSVPQVPTEDNAESRPIKGAGEGIVTAASAFESPEDFEHLLVYLNQVAESIWQLRTLKPDDALEQMMNIAILTAATKPEKFMHGHDGRKYTRQDVVFPINGKTA